MATTYRAVDEPDSPTVPPPNGGWVPVPSLSSTWEKPFVPEDCVHSKPNASQPDGSPIVTTPACPTGICLSSASKYHCVHGGHFEGRPVSWACCRCLSSRKRRGYQSSDDDWGTALYPWGSGTEPSCQRKKCKHQRCEGCALSFDGTVLGLYRSVSGHVLGAHWWKLMKPYYWKCGMCGDVEGNKLYFWGSARKRRVEFEKQKVVWEEWAAEQEDEDPDATEVEDDEETVEDDSYGYGWLVDSDGELLSDMEDEDVDMVNGADSEDGEGDGEEDDDDDDDDSDDSDKDSSPSDDNDPSNTYNDTEEYEKYLNRARLLRDEFTDNESAGHVMLGTPCFNQCPGELGPSSILFSKICKPLCTLDGRIVTNGLWWEDLMAADKPGDAWTGLDLSWADDNEELGKMHKKARKEWEKKRKFPVKRKFMLMNHVIKGVDKKGNVEYYLDEEGKPIVGEGVWVGTTQSTTETG